MMPADNSYPHSLSEVLANEFQDAPIRTTLLCFLSHLCDKTILRLSAQMLFFAFRNDLHFEVHIVETA